MNDEFDDKLAVKPIRAAKLLDMSRTSLYDLLNKGEIRGVRIGGMWRVPMSEIKRILEANAR